MSGERIIADPLGLVPIETLDCNAVIAKGDGGARPLPVFQYQWGESAGKYVRVAYPLTRRFRKLLLREPDVALTVVIRVGANGLEEISAKFQLVELVSGGGLRKGLDA